MLCVVIQTRKKYCNFQNLAIFEIWVKFVYQVQILRYWLYTSDSDMRVKLVS